jgi:hypothetical protein
MRPILSALLSFLTTLLRSRLALQLEIVALRHQVAVYQRSISRPRLHATDRLFWVWLSRLWGIVSALLRSGCGFPTGVEDEMRTPTGLYDIVNAMPLTSHKSAKGFSIV